MSRRRRNLNARRELEGPRHPRPKSKLCKRTGKLGYATREDAVTSMAEFSRQKRFKGQSVYFCEHCRRYHTTSAVTGQKR